MYDILFFIIFSYKNYNNYLRKIFKKSTYLEKNKSKPFSLKNCNN